MFTWKEKDKIWKGEGIYHLTFAVIGRRRVLSELRWDDVNKRAWVCWSDLGRAVVDNISEISERYSDIQICGTQIMPDHVHMVLWVKSPIEKSIKEVARGFIQGCKKITGEKLLETPYIRTLSHPGQLDAMVKYVKDNPHRAMEKMRHPDLFVLRRNVIVNVDKWADSICQNIDIHNVGVTSKLVFTSMGNQHLLDWPEKRVVECSRMMTQERIDMLKAEVMRDAERGVVTVTAAISEGEKQVARTVREAGYPLVVLMKEGFPKGGSENERYYKPGGVFFEACAKGRLLLMEPEEAMYENAIVRQITEQKLRQKAEAKHMDYIQLPTTSARYRYVALNEMAHLIVR